MKTILRRLGLTIIPKLTLIVVTLPTISFSFNVPDFPLWQTGHEGQFSAPVLDSQGNAYLAGYPMRLMKITATGQIAWISQTEANSYPGYPVAIALDPAGNAYVSGSTFKSENPTNYQDFVTWKFDANGSLVWRVVYDPPDGTLDFSNGIGRDQQGNLYVVGRSIERAVPGGYHTILKYDPDGNLLWARRFEAATNSSPGNTGTLAVNPHGGVAAVANRTVASYSASGDLLWSWQGAASEVATFDSDDHLLILSLQWSGGTYQSAVQKFSASGEVLWSASYRSPVLGGIEPLDLKVDSSGHAYLAANSPIRCSRYVDDGEVFIDCFTQPLIVKYSPQGEQLWATRFSIPTNYSPDVSGLAFDPAGHPYLAARLYPFDPGAGYYDFYKSHEVFVAKCDVEGNQIWSGIFRSDSPRRLFAQGPQVDHLGNVVVSSELIDDPTSAIDLLLLKFQPYELRQPPHVITPPAAQTVARGASATLSVDASGAGRLGYQWRFNSVAITGATGRTLTVSSIQPAQAGDYSVEVRNKFGTTVTPEARVTVVP